MISIMFLTKPGWIGLVWFCQLN